MSVRAWFGPIGRRQWPVILTGVVLVAAAAAPNGAMAASPHAIAASTKAVRPARLGDPSQVIDAATDPDAAAQALKTGCANISNCSWQTTSITAAYGPPRILGDVLYNCAPEGSEDNAETAVGTTQERVSTTSLSEKVSLKLSLELIGIASSSVEFEAFSKQATTFATEVTVTNAVVVEPGWKGYTTTQALSAKVAGNTLIQGPNGLTEITNGLVTVPGYQDSQDITDQQILPNGISAPMTANDIATRCDAVNDNPLGLFGAAPPRRRVASGSYKLSLCQPVAVTGRARASAGDASCVTRRVTGPPPPATRQATATLTAHARTYAVGTDTAGRIRLNVRRTIRPGKYTLTLRRVVRRHGTRIAHHFTTIVPITIR